MDATRKEDWVLRSDPTPGCPRHRASAICKHAIRREELDGCLDNAHGSIDGSRNKNIFRRLEMSFRHMPGSLWNRMRRFVCTTYLEHYKLTKLMR